MPLIMPIKDLRNTTEISNIAHKEQEPLMQKQFLQNWRKNILDKLSPENAKGQDARIKKAILNLDTFPQSNQERNEGRYAGKGYLQLIIDNYMAIFRIDEPRKIVYVVTIQYQGWNL